MLKDKGKKPNLPQIMRRAYAHATVLVKQHLLPVKKLSDKARTKIIEGMKSSGFNSVKPASGSGGSKYPRFQKGGKIFCGHPLVMGWGSKFVTNCKHVDTKAYPAE